MEPTPTIQYDHPIGPQRPTVLQKVMRTDTREQTIYAWCLSLLVLLIAIAAGLAVLGMAVSW